MFKILTLEPKIHKRIGVVFDEGLERTYYNDLQDLAEIGNIFICFSSKTKFAENQNG